MTGEWRDRAECAGLAHRGDDPWHPDAATLRSCGRTGADPYHTARAVCATCPVTVECLAEGLTLPGSLIAHGGMRAGLAPEQIIRLLPATDPADRCASCDRLLWRGGRSSVPVGHARHESHGVCASCMSRSRRSVT